MLVIGADACSDKLVICCLEKKPTDIRQAYVSGLEFIEIPTNTVGLKKLLELKPDVVILEPTGIKYIKFWLVNLARAGIEVRLVHNTSLPAYRKVLDLPDKDDPADALALACYYFDFKDVVHRWVSQRDSDICKLRECLHRIESLNRQKNVLMNRLKQNLSSEFPENAGKGKSAVMFWGWLAGVRRSVKYDRQSASSEGLGVTDWTKFDADILYKIMIHLKDLDSEMNAILKHPKFKGYMVTFKKWKIPNRIAVAILGQIFPIESFLEDDQPRVVISRGKLSMGKKQTKKHISLRKFKKCLGVAPVREWSGKSDKKAKKSGSALARKSLWRWLFTEIEPRRVRFSATLHPYRENLNDMKLAGVPVRKARSRVCAKVVKGLFYDLVYTLHPKGEVIAA